MSVSASCLRTLLLIAGGLCVFAGEARAAGFLVPTAAPQSPRAARSWQLVRESVDADVSEPIAVVTVSQVFRNLTTVPLEARYVFPLPRSSTLSGVTLFEGGKPLEGRLLRGKAATDALEQILRSQRDTALIRYYGQDLFEVRISPLQPEESTTLTLKYVQRIRTDAGAAEWVHAVPGAYAGPEEGVDFEMHLNVKALNLDPNAPSGQGPRMSADLGPVYCPNYNVNVGRTYSGATSASLRTRLHSDDPDVALYWSASGSSMGAMLLTYWPEEDAQGYFLFLAEPSRDATLSRTARPKVIHFVVDTSSSMAGEKLAQVRTALRQVVASLNARDRFNIIAYSDSVTNLWETPQVVSTESRRQAAKFVDGLRTAGGTNIEAALAAVLRSQPAASGMPSVVVFLTDGRPTLGEVDPHKIIDSVLKDPSENQTRIYCVGVGVDVNTVLLDRLSLESRGVPEYVLPREDVERHVATLYENIRYPILSDITYDFGSVRATAVLPAAPADLYRGGRLILAGRYSQGGQVEVVLRGQDGSYVREYRKTLKAATRGHGVLSDFPARIWATRRVAALIDGLRLYGLKDQRIVDGIVTLSKRFGVVTEYTPYLAGDAPGPHTSVANRDVTQSLLRAQTPRAVGNVAWAQSKNQQLRRAADAVPRREREIYVAGTNDRDVETLNLGTRARAWPRVVANRTFYFRRDRGWVDASIEDPSKISEKLYRWSPDFYKIVRGASPDVNTRLAQEGDVLLKLGDRTIHVVDGR